MRLRDEPFLGRCLDLTARIAEYDGKIGRIAGIAYDPPDGLPAAKKEKPRGDGKRPVVDDKVDLEAVRSRLIAEREAAKQEIVAAINAMEGDPRTERILYACFVEEKPIKEVALEERISYSYACKILKQGSEEIRKGTKDAERDD